MVNQLSKSLSINSKFTISKGLIIDLFDFKIEILDFDLGGANIRIYDNKGIYSTEGNFKIDYKEDSSVGTIKVGEQISLSKYLFDASESWIIRLVSVGA